MINISLQGHLKLGEQLKWLALPLPERRKVHGWLATDLQRAMKRVVRQSVEASSLEHFENDARVRRRRARSFASMIGRKASASEVVLFDKGTGHRRRKSRDDRATEAQALRMRELGFHLSKRQIRLRFTKTLAGFLIRKIETSKGIERKKLRKRKTGSLILMVWREKGQEILASVDPAQVFRRYITAHLNL